MKIILKGNVYDWYEDKIVILKQYISDITHCESFFMVHRLPKLSGFVGT